ncbi:unnamed protein product [Phyllotreta striolata]|uniref:Peptidase S1 domain-containing protein n=1 Tax=Phyllotreta striolata TaxID=444603 RepID=A0A9N9XLF1_PHYSR|nr:unnamed protein product [Phyllotreta striolata]
MLHLSKFIYLLFLWFDCMTDSDKQYNDFIEVLKKCKCLPYYLCENITNADDLATSRQIQPEHIRCKGSYNQQLVCCKLEKYNNITGNLQETTTITTSKKKTCGQQLTFVTPRIMSTVEDFTNKGELPWTAIIYVKNNANEWKFCGTGALISPRVILTAYHLCNHFRKAPVKYKVVMTGDAVRRKVGKNAENQRNVVEIIKHPSYDLGFDAALLILDRKFSSDAINTICLPSDDTNENSGRCLVSGWGTTAEFQGVPMLKKMNVPLVPFDKCQASLRKTILGNYFQLNNFFICAGGEDEMDACIGGGGSALMCPTPDGDRYYHAGIVSWGVQWGNKGIPGVYVSTRKIKGWITMELSRRYLAF